MPRKIKYETDLRESLKDPEEAVAYLNAALEDEDLGVFLLALKDVIKASPLGIAGISKKAKMERTHLYRMLSQRGNPEMKSVNSVLNSLGFRLYIANNNPRKNTSP